MFTTTSKAGFSDIALESQEVFRVILDAMSRPGTVHTLRPKMLETPDGLTYAATAVCLALVDNDAPIWLDRKARTRESESYLRFHCGAVFAPSSNEASFALLGSPSGMPALSAFNQGLPEYPDRSTTLILQVEEIDEGKSGSLTIRLFGPGIPAGLEGKQFSVSGLPENFVEEWSENQSSFPLGVDCILCSDDRIACLPRTTRVCSPDKTDKPEASCM